MIRRFGLRDDQWDWIKDLLPGREGSVGVTAADNRLFVEAVLYRYRTGGWPRQSAPSRLHRHPTTGFDAGMASLDRTPDRRMRLAWFPAIEQTFDLDVVLAVSIGPSWNALPDDQKTPLQAAFRRYRVASYTANFDNYTSKTFHIAPALRNGAMHSMPLSRSSYP
jgi:hypothetical protein